MAKDFISDEEMEALEKQGKAKDLTSNEPPDFLTDDEMAALEAKSRPTVDRITKPFSPSDAFLSDEDKERFTRGMDPGSIYEESISAPIRKIITEAFTGRELENAPTGKEQAQMMGVTDKTFLELVDPDKKDQGGVVGRLTSKALDSVSPAGAVGFGLEAIQDPGVLVSPLAYGAISSGKAFKKAKDLISKGAKSRLEDAVDAVSDMNPQFANIAEASGKRSGVFGHWPTPLEEMTIQDGFKRMREIEYVVPDLTHTPRSIHYEMLRSGKNMRDIKNKINNLPERDVKAFIDYNSAMLNESQNKILEIPTLIAKKDPLPLSDEGNDIVRVVREIYQGERAKLAPLFDELQTISRPLSADESKDLAIAILENSRAKGLIALGEDGSVGLKDFSPSFGMSQKEYGVLKKVIERLNEPATFEDIQNIREFMRREIDPTNPKAFSTLNSGRKVMLDYLEGMAADIDQAVSKSGRPSNRVQSVFREYARNERAKDSIEDIIGGSIDSFDLMNKANQDKIVGKILANPNHTEAFKQYVGQDKLDEILGSFIADGIQKSIHPTQGFRPHMLQNWLQKNSATLQRNLPQEVLDRLNALADMGWLSKRFLDHVNPSGTADALMSKGGGGVVSELLKGNPLGAGRAAQKGVTEAIQRGAARRDVRRIERKPKPTPLRPETPIEKAKRINEERRMQKGQ